MRSKMTERSHLSIFRLGHRFAFKLNPIGKACALTCFFALASQSAFAQNKIAANTLPTGGQVVAGSATISSSQTATSATMNINQTSQRAVINWSTFNVGKNATVNFNQPNSSAVTLNRVTSATPSIVEGAIRANGQVVLVNPNGVNFGKGAEVHAAGVVASTLDINNKDFMEGRNTYSGNGQGKIVNEGKIVATDPNGYIALLAPEVRNEGYLLARKGAGSTIAIASGEKITLDFRGTQLVRVSVDVATYKGLIENKRVIEVNGGLVVLAAGTARDLMSSLIQNTGRISANAIVDNGGVIDIVATNVNQAGTISANGKGANSTGGQINIVAENITLAANSKTTATGQAGGGAIQIGVGKTAATNTPAVASSTANAATAQTAAQILASNPQTANQQAKTVIVEEGASVNASAITQGNGGSIVIWSQVKTVVNGVLSAVGGYLNGNGGLIETSSAGTVVLGKSLSVTTAAPKGKSGLWFLDPIDLTIDSSAANVISAALTNNSVSIAVNGNVCPSLGACTQNGSGSLTIASGANILKESGNLTTLTLTSSGIFNLNADISGQNLNVIINSSIAYLNVGTTINANQVTVQAQTIYSYGAINAGNSTNLGSAIQLLASAIYVSGGLQVGSNLANSSNTTNSNNTISYNGTLIRREDLPNYLATANQTGVNLDQVYSTAASNQSTYTSTASNQITLTGTNSITVSATAQLLANGTFGGSIIASAPQINLLAPSQNSGQIAQGSGSLIQANGNNGPGGTIALTAANDFNINSATISANGSTDGGSIRLITSAGNLLLSNSLIQTNGGTGRGGSLGVSAANDTTINSSTLEATGFTKGGSIMVGYDSAGKSIPFSQSTTIDASTILSANQTDGTNSTDGGLIETSGGTLVQLASINAGRGGMWLLDPYDYIIGANEAAAIVAVLNSRSNVTISTSAASSNGINANSGNNGTGTISVISDIVEPTQNGGGSELLTLDAGTQKIYLSANINTRGGVNFSSPVVLRRNTVTLSSDVNYMNFASTVDGDPGFQMASLVINSSAIFNGNVGSTTPLANLKVTGITQIYGDITVYGGSSNQFYGTNAAIYLTGAVTLRGNARVSSIGDSGIVFLSSVVTGEYLPASTNGNTNLTVAAAAGDIYFGNTVNLTGSLITTAGTTYLGSNVSTTGSQTYNSNVVVMSAYTQIQPNGNLTITGTLAGSYYANSPIFLFANGAYGGSNTGQLSIGQSVSLSGGTLTYIGGTSSQTTYTWTPLYDAVGAVLAVGGGSGGAGGYAGGTGGNGGSVIINRMVEFTPNSTYTLSVGNGGAGGGLYSAGGNGGDTSVVLGGASWITATGGICCSAAGNGGANPALPNPPYGYVPGNGIQAFSLLGMGNNSGVVAGFTSIHTYQSGASTYTQVINGSNGTYFGAGANNGSTTSNLAGLPADTNTGSGGGGGAHLANGMTNVGGDGASGVLMFNQVISGTTSVDINVTSSGRVSIGAISGKTNGTINGYSISDGNSGYVLGSSLANVGISAGSSSNVVSGNIQGGVALSYAGLTPTSKLLLTGNNTTSAGITVSVGTLVAGSATAFGSNGNLVSIGSANSAIDLNGQSLSGSILSIAGTGINSNGALINSNSSTPASYSGALTLTGGAYIGGPGAIVFGGVVNTSGRDLSFVNSASVNASNSDNQISTISGLNAGNVTLVSKTLLTIGTANSLAGLLGQSGNLSFYGLAGILVNSNIVAQSIYLFGRASIGVEIQSATLHATNAGITIYGNGDFFGSGVYIGGTSLLITDSSSGNISISGYAPRLGVTFGGFGGSGGRTNTTATSTSPLAIDSANNISINGYADYSGTNGDILGVNLNTGLSTAQYALLNARGNGSIYLSGASPNCNCSSYTIGAAVSVVNTPMNAANEITIGGAILNNMGVVNGVTIGNVAASSFMSGPLHVSSVTSNQYANGGFQPYGVNISNSSTVYYSGGTYGNTFAGGSISIFGSSSSGIGVNSASNFNSGAGSLEIGATGNGNANAGAINIAGSITKSGAEAANITIASTYNVALANITDSATAPIRIIAGNGISAGTSDGGTITSLGTISLTAQSSRPTIGLSMAAPENGTCQTAGCIIEAAVGITAANASTSTNVAYNVAGGDFSNASTRTGNFINYRYALTSNTYDVSLGSNYSAVYGTPFNSPTANYWLQTNSALTISGVTFGVTTSSAQASLRFMSTINGSLSSNSVQSGTALTSSGLYSTDGAVVNLTSAGRTYTITPAPLGIAVTGVYNNSTTITPTSFTVYGLVNGEDINSLSSATVAFKDVLAGNNYVTGIVIGTGTVSLSNYQINPLGRNTTPVSALQNMATINPVAITVTGVTASNKVYDGTTTAVVNSSSATLNGKISGDNVTLSMTAGSFMSPGVGTGISVSGAGSLQGSSASNYTLNSIILSANITPAPLGITVVGTYSNSTTIAPTSFTTTGLVNGETITTLTSAIVSNKNVSANGSNYVTSITKGNGTATLSNYAINTSYNSSSGNTQNTATIDPKVLSVTGTAVADKVYNGTASATLTNGVLNGVNPGDSITLTQAGEFSQANVGTSITIVARDTISDSSGNYVLQQPQTLNASITPKLVTLSATKTYDATTSLTGVVNIGGLVGSETLNYTGATAYSANAGGVNFITAMTLANGSNGGLASNYALPSLGTFANAPVTITPKALNLSANKVYDATTSLTGAITINGLISGQTLNYSGATAHTASAGSTYIDAITITDGTGGGLASNYQVPTLTSAYTYNNVNISRKVVSLSASKIYDGSTDLTGAVTIGSLVGSQTLTYSNAVASDANVTTANKYISSITLADGSGGGLASNYMLPTFGAITTPVTITPKALTVTGTTVPDKVYDGTTATVLAGGTLVGVVARDVGSVTLNQAGTFASPNAGTNVAVVANDSLNLTASAVGNYTLIQPTTTTGNIAPKALTVLGTTVDNKVYDGTGLATLRGGTLVGVVDGDATSVSLTQAGVFAQWNTGGAIAVLPSDSISGPKAANYTLTQPTGLGADITPRPLGITVTGVYNGTNAISVTSFTTNGLVTGEAILTLSSVSVSNPNVAATGKYVGALLAYTGNTSSGSVNQFWGSNYSITQAYNPTAGNTQNIATITPIALTVTGTTVPNKVYDGSTATTLANGVLNGVIDGQTVGLVQAGTFASPNAGNNVAVVANDSLSGDAAVLSNYTLIQPTTTTGNITPAPVTVTNTTVANKTYDGTNVATLTGGTLNGVIAGDLTNITLTQAGTFASVNVGSSIAVTATDSLSGTKAANYTLTQPSVSSANITPAPLGISITNAVYQASTSLYPVGLNFTVTGLVHGETITTLGSATAANANVSANGSNYLTAITVGTGTANLSNYSLNSAYSAATNNTQNKVTLTPMLVTVTGTTVPDKVYDGTTTTTLAGGTLVGVFSNDRNNVSLNQSGTFASPNAGNNVAVVANDSLNLTASAIGNYTLVQPTTTTGNITRAPVTVNNTSVANKVYDGTNTATLTNGTLSGVIAGDLGNVTLNQAGTFASVNVGNAIAVTATDSLSGTKAANYTLTQPSVSAANITAKTLTVTGTTAANKVYDGTDSATLTGGTLVGVISGETITLNQVGSFASVNVGTGITVSASDSISGTTSGNYTLIQPTAVGANITPKALTVTGTTVPDKVYDGTTTTVLTGGTLVGVVARDVGNVTLNQTGTFASPNAGTNVAVVANDSLNLTASAVGNYTLVQPTTTTGNITKAPLGVTVTGVYSGGALLPTAFTTNGLVNNETITALSSATTYSPNINAGSNYVTGITIGGGTASMNNYVLSLTRNTIVGNTQNDVTITPKIVSFSATKTYDGTLTGGLTGAAITISGLVGNQTLNYSGASLNDANVGSNKYLTSIMLVDGTGANGGLASNYGLPNLTLASASNSATIAPKAVALSANKTYDGTTNLAGFVTITTGVGSETLTYTGATAASANVLGANYLNAITLADGANGGLASNYILPNLTAASAGNIVAIAPKALNLSATKTYDGTGVLTGNVTINGLIGAQTLTYIGATAHNVNAGSTYIDAITITDGANGGLASNYQAPTLTSAYTYNNVTITPKVVTLSASKVYDGTTDLSGAVTIGGLIGSQTLNYTGATANDANVVQANKYIAAMTLTNGSGLASNYVLPIFNATNAPVTITARPLTVTGTTAADKMYDGTTAATVSGGALVGVVGSEVVTLTQAGNFVSANVGSGIGVIANDSISGLASSNYTLVQPTTTASITKALLGVSVTASYSASTAVAPTSFTTYGLVNGETITALSAATFQNMNVSSNGSNFVSDITISGGSASMNNYALTQAYNTSVSKTQNIATLTPKAITVSGTVVANKEYNASITANLSGGTLVGVYAADLANVTLTQAGSFVSPDIGNINVTAANTIGGTASTNYSLVQPTGLSGLITAKALYITASAQTKVYGNLNAGTSNSDDGTNTSTQTVNYVNGIATNSYQGFSVSGLAGSDVVNTVTLTSAGGLATAAVANGPYVITASGAVGTGLGNYAIQYVSNNYSTLTVTARPLNVTVANATMAYGSMALPNFSSTVTGLVNGDQANVVISTTANPYNLSAGSASNVGSYAITAASVSNPNYYPVSTNGTLTVTPINLNIQASTQGGPGSPILYGSPTVLKQSSSQNPLDNALTATGLTNGDYVSGAAITFNGAATVSGTTAAGTYTGGLQIANATGSGLANYNITYTPGNLIIGKALLTVSAANDAKLQGQADTTNFNGVIFSGFKNGENASVVNLNGLSITRTNPTVNAVGTYTGVLQVGGIDSLNYSIAFAPGNFTIVGPGQLLVKVAPAITQYGTTATYANPVAMYIPSSIVNPTANSVVSLTATMSSPGVVTVTDGTSSMNVNLAIANAVNSSSGNLIVGAYGLDSRVQPAVSAGFASQFNSTVTVGGLTVTPKVLSFSDFGVSGVSKVYDGSTSMNNMGFAPATPVFISQDMVNPVANGAFADRHVGINKSYTVGVTFAGIDAGNYVMSGGAIYTADGATGVNHGPANGSITQLNSVTYIGATSGGAWSDPNSWRPTNGATPGAIPDRANVANIVIPVGNTVVYDSQVLGPVTANLLNSGNVNFNALANLAISMNISGTGNITIGGANEVTLSGSNTYTGNAIISSGATLRATAYNSIGIGNIQGLGGSFGTSPGVVLPQLNASGSLRLITDITTTGNQTYGNFTVTQARTTLLSQSGNIYLNGLVDASVAKGNTLLVQASSGDVYIRGSIGSILPINVLEVDAVRTYIYADVLTSDQQNYCGAGGCYTALTLPQLTANYCSTNDCFSKNNNTSAFSLLATGTGGSGDFAKNTNIGQVFIGDNGQVGFLYNTYNSYATSAFGATAPLFQNNPVFARTLISRDPMVNFGSYISDASANATHTMQVAAIQVPGVTSAPTVQLSGSGNTPNTSSLFSLNALTQTISSINSMSGSIRNAANSTLQTLTNISLGSNSVNLNNVNVVTPTLNVVIPANTGTFTASGASITVNNVNVNGRATATIAGARMTSYTPAAKAAPVTAVNAGRNSFIMSSVSQQTKLDRKYSVEASVDVGEIEMDDRPADKDKDEEQGKKKKGGKTT